MNAAIRHHKDITNIWSQGYSGDVKEPAKIQQCFYTVKLQPLFRWFMINYSIDRDGMNNPISVDDKIISGSFYKKLPGCGVLINFIIKNVDGSIDVGVIKGDRHIKGFIKVDAGMSWKEIFNEAKSVFDQILI
jgi:hypothetical protein